MGISVQGKWQVSIADKTLHRLLLVLLGALLLVLLPVWAISQENAEFTLEPYHRQVRLSGLTAAKSEMVLSSEVSGRCLSVSAEVGEVLAADGNFAVLDPTFIKIDLVAEENAEGQTTRRLAQERKNLERFAKLRQSQSTAQVSYEEAALAVDLLELALIQHQTQKKRLAELLSRYQLRGENGYTVMARQVQPGEYVAAGRQVAQLGDFRSLRVALALSYAELTTLYGLPDLELFFPDSGQRAAAELWRVAPQHDPLTRKITVDLLLGPPEVAAKGLRGGMEAVLTLADRSPGQGFVIPADALVSRYESYRLIRPDGTAMPVRLLGSGHLPGTLVVQGEELAVGQRYLARPESSRAGDSRQ